MRKTRLLFVTVMAVFAIAAVAIAQETAYDTSGSAGSGGTKKKPKATALSFGFTVSDPSGNQPPPLQTYQILYQGGKINTGLLPACTAAKINAASGDDSVCPSKSNVGSGSLVAYVGTAGTPISGASKCLTDLTLYAGGKGHLTLFVKAGPPTCVAPIAQAIDMKYVVKGDMAGVQFTVPDELRHQLGLDITVVDAKTKFKNVVVKKGKKKTGYIESTGCSGQRKMTVTFTDETGGTHPVDKTIGKC